MLCTYATSNLPSRGTLFLNLTKPLRHTVGKVCDQLLTLYIVRVPPTTLHSRRGYFYKFRSRPLRWYIVGKASNILLIVCVFGKLNFTSLSQGNFSKFFHCLSYHMSLECRVPTYSILAPLMPLPSPLLLSKIRQKFNQFNVFFFTIYSACV